jgi:hypothetical protein
MQVLSQVYFAPTHVTGITRDTALRRAVAQPAKPPARPAGSPLPRTADAQTYPSSRLGSPTTTRFIRTRLSDIVRPASSSKLAEVRNRVRSFGGYIHMDIPEWMQENCKLLVLTSSFKGENIRCHSRSIVTWRGQLSGFAASARKKK